MNFNVDERTIYLVTHGSHAYGLNTPTSDHDLKGVCIEPREYMFGFLNRFEQKEELVSKGHSHDKVVFSIKKFFHLAADCNPNIIEVLWVDDTDIIKIDEFGEKLRNLKRDFLSKKAKHTFSGYAHAQLKRIKTHRNWLLNPPKNEPTRADFALPETTKFSKSELGALDNLVENGAADDVPSNIMELYQIERQYRNARNNWEQYQNWKKTRNPARAELEAKFFYDTKHGSHLLRLMRMCKEILQGKGVIVKRPDREELLDVKLGRVSYEQLIEESERLNADCEELYDKSLLPREPNRSKLDDECVQLVDSYLKKFG